MSGIDVTLADRPSKSYTNPAETNGLGISLLFDAFGGSALIGLGAVMGAEVEHETSIEEGFGDTRSEDAVWAVIG